NIDSTLHGEASSDTAVSNHHVRSVVPPSDEAVICRVCAPIRMQQLACRLERDLRVGDRGQRLDVNLDELEGGCGDLRGSGRHRGDHLALETDHTIREKCSVFHRAAVTELRYICLRDYRDDTRQAHSHARVDALDPGMCASRQQEAALEHAGYNQICRVAGLAGDLLEPVGS